MDAVKYGWTQRKWRKLHLTVDAGAGEIAAHVLTDGSADDAAQVPLLLRAVEGHIASVTADGACDGDPYQAAADRQRQSPPDVIIPPHAAAVLSKHLIGPKLRARTLCGQQGNVAIGVSVLNRMIRTGKPVSMRA